MGRKVTCTNVASILSPASRASFHTNDFGRGFMPSFLHPPLNSSSKLSLPIQIIPAKHRNYNRAWLNASCLEMAKPLQDDRTIEGACRARGLKNSPTQEQPKHENLIKRYTPIEKLSSPPSTPYKGAGKRGQPGWGNKRVSGRVYCRGIRRR